MTYAVRAGEGNLEGRKVTGSPWRCLFEETLRSPLVIARTFASEGKVAFAGIVVLVPWDALSGVPPPPVTRLDNG